MKKFDSDEVKLLQAEIKDGLDINEVIGKLYQYKFTVIESMKFLVSEYQISLGEAKRLVSSHPVWNEIVEASKPLHDDLIEEAKKHS